MKYIRTKDGKVIDLTRYDNKTSPVGKAFGLITLIDKKRICDLEIFEKDIINQADTIEELCDEFVCEWNVYPALCLLLKRVPKDKQKNIYGAIWTDKGLIYVAKMNDKGELELL